MAVKTIIKLSFYYLLLINIIFVHSNKLNTLKVLLPIFNDFHTNFTLEADDGCYRWSTSRHDVIQITPLDYNENLDCSIKAVVSCITKERVRNNALIIAENIYTGQYLRCDIIVDVMHSLTTITRTRELLLEEDPVKILVRANDNLGNEFSSLYGVEFNWRILSMGPSKDLTVLNFVKFDDSPYESPPGIFALESDNVHGNVVLVEGLKTGSAKISVSLPHEEYKTVEADEVQFSVIANLILMPQEVHLMMGDIISFKIYYLSYGKMEEIVLPNKQYYLKTESSDIAVADQYSSEVTGMTLGKTRVILYDRNAIDADPSTRMPSAMVNVVEAAYISLSLLPHRNWAILMSHHHDIIAEVFTNTGQKISIGKGVELHTQVGEPFHVHERAANGSWLSGWALKEGVAQAQGTLEAVTHVKYGRFVLDPPLTAQNDITIYSSITLKPSEVILPWDPIHRPKYEVEIIASGGDGKYLWTSSNNSIGIVSQLGIVRTHSHGYFEVSTSMPRNHNNRASATFWILPPIRLEIVEFIAEAEVGSTIFLHVALYAERPGREGEISNQIPFTICQELPFEIILANNRFSQEQKLAVMPVGISCANVALIGHTVGSSKVTISYSLDGINYQDSATVSAFKPLALIQPTNEIVLAIGSQVHLIFAGGPRPSTTRPQDHHRDVHVDDGAVLVAVDVTDRHSIEANDEFYTIVKVVCHKLGETKITLSIGNRALVPNCKTKNSFITVPIICGKPRSISLQPRIRVADVGSCPMDLSTDRVVVQSNQDVELDVVVRDDCGRIFLNITSLLIDWKIESPKTGIAMHKNGVFPHLSYLGTVPYGTRHYQIITPKAETGIIVVTPSLVGYRSDLLGKHHITPERPVYFDDQDESDIDVSLPPITTSISLYLVDDTVVTPDEVSLYRHPANRKYLTVKHGSGFYELVLSTATVADVEYQKSSRQIVITPKEDGELKITLIDLCLVSRPTTVIVNVVSVATIRVEMFDKVEINKCINCIVRLYDITDNLLNIPDMSMVNLQVTLQDNIATVTPVNPNVMDSSENQYTIKGISLGDTKLLFTVSGRDSQVSSSTMDLQVFPPLKLYPRNGTLIIDAVLQYSSKGGPQPDCHIEYSVKDKSTAEVDPNGILKGLSLGVTTVMARAIGTNPTTGHQIIYTEDAVDVQIIPLSGIRISAPLSRFQAATTVPMWATGLPDQLSPLIIGSHEPPIKFDWLVEDANIAIIFGIVQPTGIQYAPEDMISIRVTGTSPGRTKIHLNATVPGEVAGYRQQLVIFTASLELEVFEGLELISPKGISGRSILMAPNSNLQLLTNKDYESNLKYSLMDDTAATPTDLRRFGGGSVISISESGRLESQSNFGYSMILVSATDEFGLKQTISTVVEVKPIHYMLMSINAKWKVPVPGPVLVIPLGAEFELRASYHDNSGVAFTAGITELKLRTSRYDLVKVKLGSDNSSVTVYAKKPGTTIIKIWADSIRKTVDYVKLHVEQVIEPLVTTLTIGDIVCFHSPLTRQRLPGTARWSSTEPHLLTVLDPDHGIIQAGGVRGGHTALAHSLHPNAPLQLLVQPVTEIHILPGVEQKPLVSNSRATFRVPLVLRADGDAALKTNNLIMGWDCKKKLSSLSLSTEIIPFICHMEISSDPHKITDYNQYFSILSNFDSISGQYSCDIRPNLDGIENLSTFATNITVWAVTHTKEVISNRVQIPFIPALQFSKQLDLDETATTQQLVISGLDYVLDQVMVKAMDSSIINVADSSRPEKNTLVYDIQLIDYHPKLDEMPDHMSLELTSPLTEQSVKIFINAKAIGDNFGRLSCPVDHKSPVGSLFTSYPQFMVIMISMAIIFAATYYIYLQCMQPVLHVDLLQSNTSANVPLAQRMRISPYLGRNCAAANANLHATSARLASPQHNATMFNNSAPVYGDPNTFYNTSPELRRNRRYL